MPGGNAWALGRLEDKAMTFFNELHEPGHAFQR
jgi:hypothetical protein